VHAHFLSLATVVAVEFCSIVTTTIDCGIGLALLDHTRRGRVGESALGGLAKVVCVRHLLLLFESAVALGALADELTSTRCVIFVRHHFIEQVLIVEVDQVVGLQARR